MIRKEDALNYHSQGRKGKIEVVSTKPCITQRDLGMAYTPGVADPCREIEKNHSNFSRRSRNFGRVGVGAFFIDKPYAPCNSVRDFWE